MSTKDIIFALNEQQKREKSGKKNASLNESYKRKGNSKMNEELEYLYACPECGEEFVIDDILDDDETVECPECGAEVYPEYEGEYDDAEDYDDYDDGYYDDSLEDYDDYYDDDDDYDDPYDDDYYNEAGTKIRFKRDKHGKRRKVKTKKGFVRQADGSFRKETPEERRSREKNGRKLGKKYGKNKAAHKKATKTRMRYDSLNLDFNESAFMGLMNNVIGDVMERYDNYYDFSITSVDDATISEHDLDTLTVEATVRYENGEYDNAQFMIEGLTSDDGEVTITEMNNVFDPAGLTVTGTLKESYDVVDLGEINYTIKRRSGAPISESFQVV